MRTEGKAVGIAKNKLLRFHMVHISFINVKSVWGCDSQCVHPQALHAPDETYRTSHGRTPCQIENYRYPSITITAKTIAEKT